MRSPRRLKATLLPLNVDARPCPPQHPASSLPLARVPPVPRVPEMRATPTLVNGCGHSQLRAGRTQDLNLCVLDYHDAQRVVNLLTMALRSTHGLLDLPSPSRVSGVSSPVPQRRDSTPRARLGLADVPRPRHPLPRAAGVAFVPTRTPCAIQSCTAVRSQCTMPAGSGVLPSVLGAGTGGHPPLAPINLRP